MRLHGGTAIAMLAIAALLCVRARVCACASHPLASSRAGNPLECAPKLHARTGAGPVYNTGARACVGSGTAVLLVAEHDEAEVRVVRRCVSVLSSCAHQTARRLQQLAALQPLLSVAQLIMFGGRL